MSAHKIDVLIVAAGTGSRVGDNMPKQFLPLGGVPMLRRVMELYATHPAVQHIQVVIGAGQEKFYEQIFSPDPKPKKLLPPVIGGARRQDSVRLGMYAMAVHGPNYILIADAARPFTTLKIIDDVVNALAPDTAVFAAIPLMDTLKHQRDGHTQTIPRENHWLTQTPQAFSFAKLLALHQELQHENFTDDVALFEAADLPIHIVPGSARNIKITTAEDFQLAEAILNSSADTRIGHGFDVHRFTIGDHVWLGGVRVPHDRGVEAHSDGDVILHALTDALLGSIGAGDIGQHFPPSDPQWKNASSDQFVQHAMDLLRARGGQVGNADITVLCEAPRIGPHRDAIRTRLAELLGVSVDRVNIKATTTEKLGALGRAEGLAAEAVVLIKC